MYNVSCHGVGYDAGCLFSVGPAYVFWIRARVFLRVVHIRVLRWVSLSGVSGMAMEAIISVSGDLRLYGTSSARCRACVFETRQAAPWPSSPRSNHFSGRQCPGKGQGAVLVV